MADNEVTIKSLDEFTAEIRKLRGGGEKGRKIIYRGQSNADWEVESTSYRELKKIDETPSNKQLLDDNEERVEDAHPIAVQELGEPIYDLLILAKLRHNKARSLLIDFTKSPAVALWYACKKDENRSGKSGSKVFCLDIDPDGGFRDKFHKISRKNQTEYLSNLIKSKEISAGKIAIWQPPLDPRVAKQDSYFIFNQEGKMNNSEFDRIIIIDEEYRDETLSQIDLLFNFTGGGLYPDIPGIAESLESGAQYKLPIP